MSLYEELFVVGLCLYLCQDVISPGVELINAADLKIDLLDQPEVQVLGKVHDTKLVDNAVKVDLIVGEGVGVHQLEDVLALANVDHHLGVLLAVPRDGRRFRWLHLLLPRRLLVVELQTIHRFSQSRRRPLLS